MAKSLQLILEIIATYRVLSHLLDDLRLKCRLRAQCTISKSNCISCDSVFILISISIMYNTTIIRFGFCDIRKNQGISLGLLLG